VRSRYNEIVINEMDTSPVLYLHCKLKPRMAVSELPVILRRVPTVISWCIPRISGGGAALPGTFSHWEHETMRTWEWRISWRYQVRRPSLCKWPQACGTVEGRWTAKLTRRRRCRDIFIIATMLTFNSWRCHKTWHEKRHVSESMGCRRCLINSELRCTQLRTDLNWSFLLTFGKETAPW